MKSLKPISLAIVMLVSFVSLGQEKTILLIRDQTIQNSNTPLYIIDGIPLNQNFISKIDPNDIESVNVLKDAAATSVYGQSAINGVIIIKTKKVNKKQTQKLQELFAYEFASNKNKKEIKILGTVTDCEALALPNVNIIDLNNKINVISDSQGKYSIVTHRKDILLFAIEGYEPQRIQVNGQKIIDIKLSLIPKPHEQINIILKKPVIYLYPTQKTDITLQLDFKGKLLTTFPEYNKQWNITAYPNGKIFDKTSNRFYTSLFWDGTQVFPKTHYQYQSGFVVTKKELTNFLFEKLEYMGLNNFETNDFIQYWLPILEKNETNFIHFRTGANYDVISKNSIEPKPQTEIRIFMDFYALDKPIKIATQKLTKSVRKGFTLVEWGGSNVSNPIKELNNKKL
jgi:TonB-dependent SusC/RagA subfamily outer membrane receptor